MSFLKAIQKSLKIKPNLENLKKKRDVDGLIAAFSYYEPQSDGNGLNDRLQRLAEIAIILGDLGDIRGIPIIEKVLKQLDERNTFWQEMIQSFGEQHALAGDNRAIYNMDMNVLRSLRPHVAQALKTLRQSKH